MPFKYNPFISNLDDVGSGGGGSGDVTGPGSSTDNALARFHSTTGKVIQNSVAILDDVGALSGLTQLDVDNIQINGNTISSTDTNGDISLTPDGSGAINLTPLTGIVASNGASGTTARTLTGTSNRLSISDGDGVSGNPTFDIDASYVGQASITTLGTVTTGTWSATDVAVTAGGTGSSTASGARTNLGLAIGTDVQAHDAGLDDISALAVTDGNIIVGDGANWVAESGATARTSLGLGSIATQDANSVTITGGSITGITDLAVADGGTGASTLTGVLTGNGTSAFTASTVTEGAVLLGGASNALTDTGVLAKGVLLVGDGVGAPTELSVGSNDQVLTADSAEASGVKWAAASGGSMPPKEYWFAAESLQPLETNFAPLEKVEGTNVNVFCRAFDDTTEEYVNGKLQVPGDVDTSGTVTFRCYVWAKTAAASKNIGLTFGHLALNNGEDWDPSSPYTEEDSGAIAIDATQDDVTEATWTETITNLGWAANDLVLFRLSRDTSVTDDLTGDMYLMSLAVEIPRS